jgi:glutathione S-transferase
MNPNAKVPTLVDGELVIWESNTILRYLCNTSAGGARLYPPDPAARSQVERWMDWQLSALYAPYLGCFKEAKKTDAERAASATWAADARELGVQLQILEKGIGDRPFIAGGDLSIADIALGPIVDRCLKFPVALPALPSVGAWRDRLAARPAYKKVIS